MRLIEIRLQHIGQLFDSLDPSPFREKALERNVEAYLLECAGEQSANEPVTVQVEGPAALMPHVTDIASAIHAHFRLLHGQAERRFRRRQRVGRAAIGFGLAVLLGALLLRAWVVDWPGRIGEVLSEGLLILAWVALWRPAEVALFDAWEHRENLHLLDRLATVPVQFRSTPG